MTISTLAEFQTAIQNETHRSSLSTSIINEKLAFAESRIGRELRVRDMETDASVSIVSGTRTAALPTNYRGLKRIYLNTDPIQVINYVTPETYWSTYMSSQTGKPVAYTIEAGNFVFGPIPDSNYTAMALSLGLAALTGSVVPALFTNNPDLYLWATLVALSSYLGQSGRAGEWEGHYTIAKESVKRSDLRDRHPGILQMRAESYTP
jgi:hypothetical protein